MHRALRIAGITRLMLHAGAFPHLAAARMGRLSVRVESLGAQVDMGSLLQPQLAARVIHRQLENDALVGRAVPISKDTGGRYAGGRDGGFSGQHTDRQSRAARL